MAHLSPVQITDLQHHELNKWWLCKSLRLKVVCYRAKTNIPMFKGSRVYIRFFVLLKLNPYKSPVWRVFFYWSIVDLQCHVSFRCTAKWFIYIYVYIYIYFFQILFHYRLLQDIEYSFLCYTVDLCWLSILYIVVYICSSQAPNLPLPLTVNRYFLIIF